MNYTPRTDAKSSGENHFMGDWVDAQFARQLERELNDIKKLAEIRIDYIRQLVAEKSVSKDRIKQLEDALRRIANTDHRGNRSTESQIAAEALESKP